MGRSDGTLDYYSMVNLWVEPIALLWLILISDRHQRWYLNLFLNVLYRNGSFWWNSRLFLFYGHGLKSMVITWVEPMALKCFILISDRNQRWYLNLFLNVQNAYGSFWWNSRLFLVYGHGLKSMVNIWVEPMALMWLILISDRRQRWYLNLFLNVRYGYG